MRVAGLRYRDEWLPNLFPSRKVGENHHVRLSRVGSMQILTAQENAQLDEVFMEEALFRRLERSGHIITSENAAQVMADLKAWHTHTFKGPSLHIVVLSRRCNLNCTYCHMNPVAVSEDVKRFDMQPETLAAVIRFALSTPSNVITFEFQGGEPFLNFEGMRYFVEEARRQNQAVGKALRFSVVSNLMLVKDEHLEYCRAQGITVSYTLNGPQDVHDRYRVSRSGAGSFKVVMQRLKYFQEKFPGVLSSSPLCVVDADNAGDLLRTIDFYHAQGFKGVAILKLKHLGNAVKDGLQFDINVFLKHYIEALDYLYEKNRRENENYSERLVRVILAKILGKIDVGYMDWRNPGGDFSGAITYDYDGEILPSDEARSQREAFALGNVHTVTYDELIRRRDTFRSMNLSLRDRDAECRECAFNPYCGVLPVLDHARTGDPTPRPFESEECLQTLAMVDWVMRKLVEDPIPLLRMVPKMDEVLSDMLHSMDGSGGKEAVPDATAT
ncbi:radical SAM protein [Archangium violaceum]|uniref:radical SAM protein n=1 Tax=Archangium violaceum TaxID=83451 RepID=UPI002B3071B2|nr:radical SAM protein [Archangium gephyra]